jgi:hypothetical protein
MKPAVLSTVLFLVGAVVPHSTVVADGIALSVTTRKGQYLIAEPVVLQIALKNTGSVQQEVFSELTKGTGIMNYEVSEDGLKFRGIGAFYYHDPTGRSVTLDPGASLYHDEILLYDANAKALVFPHAGFYYVRITYPRAEPVTIGVTVKEPTTPEDVHDSQIMQLPEVLYLVTPHLAKVDKGVDQLKACAARTSSYSLYAGYFLAKKQIDESNRSDLEEQQSQAMALLQRADIEDFPLRHEAVYLKAMAYIRLGQQARAQEQLARIRSDFPRFPSDMLNHLGREVAGMGTERK